MSVEHGSSAPTRSPPSDVRAEDRHLLSLIHRRAALTATAVSPESPRTLSPVPPVPATPVRTPPTTPVLSTAHTPARGTTTSGINHEYSSNSSGRVKGCDNSAHSSAPASRGSSSRAAAPHGSLHSFFQPNPASTNATTAPKVVYFDDRKAGLRSAEKEKTEAIIKELSKNSSFYVNEERKAQQRQRQVERLLVKTRQYEASVRSHPDVFRQLRRDVADLEAIFETYRSFDSIYVHMDMDMFFAAVEMKKNPQYAEVPLGIGSMSMLSTTNYVARKYGVQSGMPGFIGMRLCPQLVIVPTDFAACRAESAKFKAVVREYDSDAQLLGMDEVMMCLDDYLAHHHMDVTTHAGRFDVAERVIEECRRRIAEATGLTVSAGIAPTPTLAKMASNYKKPNGQFAVRLFSREAVMNYLASIPVRQVPGIGKSRESVLAGLGIHTLGEVYEQRHRLFYILTRKTYEFLLASSIGIGGMYDSLEAAPSSSAGTTNGKTVAAVDGGSNEDDWGRKSVGHERTFYKLTNRMALQAIAYKNLRRSHETLAEEGLLCSQVVLKLKHRSFHVKQHSKSLNVYTDDHEVLRRALDELLMPVVDDFAEFRLLGVRLEKLRRRPRSDGTGGATALTVKSAAEAESNQLTLSHFFTRQLASTVHSVRRRQQQQQQQAFAQRKRPRGIGDGGAGDNSDAYLDDSDDEDGAVLIVSSESQLTDVEEVKGPAMSSTAPSPLSNLSTGSAAKPQKMRDEEVVGDDSADDNVFIVE
ncbi:DNA polymerase kappa, putative [Leishmania donovani]|uniref:DNA polymerase kappa n=1 Tax=Leishmania donovani TaxID=5661 RepID=A0A3Q8IEM0_LEIDO|nr:DNA polymerase kappa, putative [Leishmania donovani]